MLKLMRESFNQLKWILIAIVAAFVFGFVFLDMGLSGALGGQSDTTVFAARVNGETITYNDYYRALKNYEDMYRQMYGGQFTPEMAAAMKLPQQVMESLIEQRLIAQQARKLNLAATPEEVRKKLLAIPVFNQDGKFVGMELYNRYVTGPLGYPSAAEFEAALARDIATSKMDSVLTNAVVISPKAADLEYKRVNENAKIRYVVLPAMQQAAGVTVTPQEVDAYYRNNQSKYTHGEQRTVRYLLADYAKLRAQVQPTEADLRKKYEESKDQYTTKEAAHVLHILIKVEPNAPPPAVAAAKAKADAIVAQLRGGADFATVARANSQDPSSAGNGGDMNWVERGVTVDVFDQVIFQIPLNTISDPIRSADYGFHIVKVLDRRAGGQRPFEEVRGELAARTAETMVREQAQNEINRLSAILAGKKIGNAPEFITYANDKVTSNDSGWVQKTDEIPGIGAHQPLQEWIFSASKNDVSPSIGTPRGPVIAYLENIRPSGVSALQEVRAKVEEDVRQTKAADAAKSTLAQMMVGATSVDQIAAKAGLAAQEGSANRQGSIPGITGDITPLVDAAIAANVGEMKGPLSVKEGAVAFQVLEQKKVTEQELTANRATFINQLRQQQARSLRQSLVKRLRSQSKIEVNDQLVNPPAQQPQQQAGL
ncbi:MAG TPA: SurA N-terminal domain-containing protein [Thermoanaerobaculia bacterium]|nr:SurA N-terminal domain-containing protein [Thermoanaerobaculia bacterium]